MHKEWPETIPRVEGGWHRFGCELGAGGGVAPIPRPRRCVLRSLYPTRSRPALVSRSAHYGGPARRARPARGRGIGQH